MEIVKNKFFSNIFDDIDSTNKYITKTDKIIKLIIRRNNPNIENRLYNILYKKYIIDRSNINDKEIRKRYNISINNDKNISYDEFYESCVNSIILQQKSSLDKIIYHLFFKRDTIYPLWCSIWAFKAIIKLDKYNLEKKRFYKRNKSTLNPFISFDKILLYKAISYIYNKSLNINNINNEEIMNIINSLSFNNIYSYLLYEKNKVFNISNKGKWIKYTIDNYTKLYQSLQGYSTNWCIANDFFINEEYLSNGTIEVYYSDKVPCISIRTFKNNIIEVRGRLIDFNVDDSQLDIIKDKLKDYNNNNPRIDKTLSDMYKLRDIYIKYKTNEELSLQELIFIYEINSKINYFGKKEDNRINEILSNRDNNRDLNRIFNNIDTINGNLELNRFKQLNGVIFPKLTKGNIILNNVEVITNCIFRGIVEGSIICNELKELKDTVLSRYVKGSVMFNKLEVLNNVMFPNIVEMFINITSIKYITNVVFSEIVLANLNLHSLEEMENVILPNEVMDIYMPNLKTYTNVTNIEKYISKTHVL